MPRRFLVVFVVFSLCAGCASEKTSDRKVSVKGNDSTASIAGTVQLALRSGDVKNVAFTTVRLATQEYHVLTDAEKEASAFDADLLRDARTTGVMSLDEYTRRMDSLHSMVASFRTRMPERSAVPAVASVQTNGNGAYIFQNVVPGTYWINVDAEVGINYVAWTVQVTVRAGESVHCDLNNTNLEYSFHF
jgi:hypothetical protein